MVKNPASKTHQIYTKAINLHRRYQGKISLSLKCPITRHSFDYYYTPGVAAVCRQIQKDCRQVFNLTWRANAIAIVTDGTRVLGLGNIGAEAALPVMEGKALLFKYLAGVDAVPLCLGTTSEAEIVSLVKKIAPSFSGINLEDIEAPKCFRILRTLQKELDIPVWHDDQQGTAMVVAAGLLNALYLVGKDIYRVRLTIIGAGAAGIAIARLLIRLGLPGKNIIMVDSVGILNRRRIDKNLSPEKKKICYLTNQSNRGGGIKEALVGQDAVVAVSRPGPGIIKPAWIKTMAPHPIVFACANPLPEIYPPEAKKAGAVIVATGRSDYPNQVNNSLVFPAVFRGVLESRCPKITEEMCRAGAEELAGYARRQNWFGPEKILPDMNDTRAYIQVATAVGWQAIKDGLAGLKLSRQELYRRIKEKISLARKDR